MYTLIHQDPRFYLVDKHPGASFHREGDAPGLMDALRAGLDDEALWPVHRLDRITSGLILVARSAGRRARWATRWPGARSRNTTWPCRTASR
ncbi:pseudouridine synthase Rlu family protein [Chromobacterium violaceum]|uniref:Pseudouridine synthase Rlu family protein n=1 Tax=Chromobacterium violaceum TaxID=536 RepID=A0A447T8J1_CHRVL|nr:pseudouridine synthase Rlu family protein [Chromobacterium violaceum]